MKGRRPFPYYYDISIHWNIILPTIIDYLYFHILNESSNVVYPIKIFILCNSAAFIIGAFNLMRKKSVLNKNKLFVSYIHLSLIFTRLQV